MTPGFVSDLFGVGGARFFLYHDTKLTLEWVFEVVMLAGIAARRVEHLAGGCT
jgi:hypothetical protein